MRNKVGHVGPTHLSKFSLDNTLYFFAIHHSPLSPACLIQDAVERKHLYLTCSFTLDSFLLLLTQYYIVIEEHGGGGGRVCV